MAHKVGITETIYRDAHQSLWATRMNTDEMMAVAEAIDEVGFHSLEAWGGATFDTCLRFLKEDPWVRLRRLKAVIQDSARCCFGGRTSWVTGITPMMCPGFITRPRESDDILDFKNHK